MFEDYKGTIDIGTFLKENFNYDFNGNLKELYQQPFIEMEGDGVDALFWIIYKDERYLFKPLNDCKYNMWSELICSKLAEKLGLKVAKYRVAKFGNLEGVITKSFLDKDEKLILGAEIFQNFFNHYPHKESSKHLINNKKVRELYQLPDEFIKYNAYDRKRYIFNHLNNIEDVWSILELIYHTDKEETKNIIDYLMKLLVFDLITIQGDRHPNNWGIIKKGNKYLPCTIFDNATSLGLGYPNVQNEIIKLRSEIMNQRWSQNKNIIHDIIYRSYPSFTLSNELIIDPTKKIKEKVPKVLEQIIKKSDESSLDIYLKPIIDFDFDMLDAIIKEIENENEVKMSDDLYYNIFNILKYNIDMLQEIIHNLRKEYNNGRTK